ncbi:MAG: helix-turn-helix domain-containing protein [Gemmatimonadaceae bacterium]
MLTRMRCVVPLFDQHSGRRIVPVEDQRSVATAQALDWPGVLLEAGRNDVAEVDDLTLAHHYIGVNASRAPIRMEVKEEHGFRAVVLPQGTAWLVPAGQGFSLRVREASPHAYVRISIDPLRFDRLVSTSEDRTKPPALRRTYGIDGPQVQYLVSALTEEARTGTPSGIAFVETLTTALGLQLVKLAGIEPRHRDVARGGLAPAVRRRVLELMEAQASAHLTIDALAREAGLSPAHFARAFKESVGRAPHQHLLAIRLERARRLLDAPDAALSDVAFRTGFADQAHFTRFFKRYFGMTPGALRQSHRRAS